MAITASTYRPQAPAAPPRPSRMSLDQATEGRIDYPWLMIVYGTEGVGKSSLALEMDDAITLDIEGSTRELNLRRFPRPPEGYVLEDIYDAIDELKFRNVKKIKTLVIDTGDALEQLIAKTLIARSNKKSIEDFGFGKGHQYVLDEMRIVVQRLDELRGHGVNVLIVAHAQVTTFKNPEGDDYDRWTLRMNPKVGGFLKEQANDVLFARFEEAIDDKGKRARGVFTGARVLHTNRQAAYDAKNRHSLPEEIPLDWRTLEAAMKAGVPTNPAEYRAACEDRLAQLKTRLTAQEHTDLVARMAKADDAALPKALDYLNGRLR